MGSRKSRTKTRSVNVLGKSKKKVINTTRKFRGMMCSPESNNSKLGGNIVPNSCYTPTILLRIRDMYNKNNPDGKIEGDDLHYIHTQLKERITACNSEDCWLNQLSDKDRKYLDGRVFAPDKPKMWKTNPNMWLSNYDILDVISQYETAYKTFKFIGPTPMDFDTKLPEDNGRCVWNDMCGFSLKKYIDSGVTKVGIIFNMDKHDQSGSHWVSMFIDLVSCTIFYFDSAANPTPPEIKTFVSRVKALGKELRPAKTFKYTENYPNSHQRGNTECGMYSLFFLITMLVENTKMPDRRKRALFKSGKISDKQVEQFRSIYYNT